MKRIRELKAIVKRYCDDFEVTRYGSKHLCVTLKLHGTTRKITASMSGSDHRGILNFESDVRRVMRELRQSRRQRHTRGTAQK